jgi:hypothetical protein
LRSCSAMPAFSLRSEYSLIFFDQGAFCGKELQGADW